MISVQENSVLMWLRVWFAKCRIAIGTTSIHYPFRAPTNTEGVTSIIYSPRKGTHKPVKINMERPKKQLRCQECLAHTSFKCSKCGNLERSVTFCKLITGCNFGVHFTRDVYLTSQAAKHQGWTVKVTSKISIIWKSICWNILVPLERSEIHQVKYKQDLLPQESIYLWLHRRLLLARKSKRCAFIFLIDVYLCIYSALYKIFRIFLYIRFHWTVHLWYHFNKY